MLARGRGEDRRIHTPAARVPMGPLDKLMASAGGNPLPLLGGFPGADAGRLRGVASRFADREVLTAGGATAVRHCVVCRTVGPAMPQARDVARNIHDLGADTRELGLPAAFVFNVA